MNLGNAIAELRLELNDPATTANPQGKRYSDSLFANWLNAGVQLVYHFRKDLFMQTSVVKATAGDMQKPCGFDRIHSIDGLTDECGNVKKKLNQQTTDLLGLYPERNCDVKDSGLITAADCPAPDTYTIDQNIPGVFFVNPPVAAGQDVYYRVTGSVPPKPFDCNLSESICQSTQVSIPAMFFARHMAYSTETESATSRAMSDQQLGIFFKLLGIFKDADKKYCKSFCTN